MHSLQERLNDFRTHESHLTLHSSKPRRLHALPQEAATHGLHAVVPCNAWPHPQGTTKGWLVATMALAMVLIALATVVGGGATTWHYWNVEKRAAQGEQQAARQRDLDWWKGEMQRAEATRQQHQQLEEARVKIKSCAFVATIPTTQE
jgi:uncharacterized protein HemX